MFWENKIDLWAQKMRTRSNLPIRVILWNQQQLDLGIFDAPLVTLFVPHRRAVKYLFTPSLSNLGSAYVESEIDIQGKLSDIIRIGNQLAHSVLQADNKWGRITRAAYKFKHTRDKDSEAIRYHYDISNQFYQLWLDENMVYSCAYFEQGDETLAQAQLQKIDHILTKIQLKPGHTLLDIGCGWGALVMRAAQKFGAHCIGITLSENQYAWAKERVARAGLSDKIEIRLQDYRDVSVSQQGTHFSSGTQQFDRITSVGMFEHVGIQNLPAYFSTVNKLLKDDGLVMNHGITSTDVNNGETPYGAGEFVEKYVFPHGELPHIGKVLRAMQEGGLEVFDVENLRRHYAKTLSMWADNFEDETLAIKAKAGEKRYRIWRMYLAGCAHAFETDLISLYQIVCGKAGRSAQVLPWSRRYMYENR